MRKNFKFFTTSLIIALDFASPRTSYGMVQDEFTYFSNLPKVLQKEIVKYCSFVIGESNKHSGIFKCVSKYWNNALTQDDQGINKDEMKNSWHEGRLVHLQQKYNITDPNDIESLKIFYNGQLIFKPDQNSDKEKIILKISELPNPLNGRLDLLKWEVGEHVSISTGYREHDHII